MLLLLNDMPALLPKGTSFEYTSENPYFSSGSTGYSLSITLPLRGCTQNQAIFGLLFRPDASISTARFSAEIQTPSLHLHGAAVITELTEAQVKIQFLEGATIDAVSNPLDEIYLNELSLPYTAGITKTSTPDQLWIPTDGAGNLTAVALPWVNEASGNIQNKVRASASASCGYEWHPDTRGCSKMHYLITVTQAICLAAGYNIDLSPWKNDPARKFILCCNALPYAWGDLNLGAVLPHWTLSEYLQKLSLFLGCEFHTDHSSRSIKMQWTADSLAALPPVELPEVLREVTFTVEDVNPKQPDYLGNKPLVYKSPSQSQWKFMDCDWLMRSGMAEREEFATFDDLRKTALTMASYRSSDDLEPTGHRILYARDIDANFLLRPLASIASGKVTSAKDKGYSFCATLQPINLFGPRTEVKEGEKGAELEFVPVVIDRTDMANGPMPFLSFSGYDETDPQAQADDRIIKPRALMALEAGEAKRPEYYDRIFVAIYRGREEGSKPPRPYVSDLEISDDTAWGNLRRRAFSLRLNSDNTLATPAVHPEVDYTRKASFRWLSSAIPDPRSTFIIYGKRYLCSKITATFTEQGMSRLLKGEFYPLP